MNMMAMIFFPGNEAAYTSVANAGDRDYQELVKIMFANEEEHFATSLGNALEKVDNSRTVLHVYQEMLSGYFR